MKIQFYLLILFTVITFNNKLLAQNQGGPGKKERGISIYAAAGYTSFTFNESGFEEILIEHNNQWRNTTNYDLAISYHANPIWTFSITGSQIRSSAKTENIIAVSQTDTFIGFLEDNITIKSLGFLAEKSLFKKETFSIGFLVGLDYFYYENNGHFIVDKFLLDGGDVSFRLGAFFELNLSKNLFVNLRGQYVSSTLKNPSYQPVNPQLAVLVDSQDLTRMEFSIGLRYSFLRDSKGKKKRQNKEDEEYVPKTRFE